MKNESRVAVPVTSKTRRLALVWPWVAAALALLGRPRLARSASVETREYSLDNFDELVVALPAQVTVSPGEKASMTVSAEPKVLAAVAVKQTGKQVQITSIDSYQTELSIVVEVSTPSLTSLEVSKAGDVTLVGPLGTDLLLKAQDASAITLSEMNLESLDTDLSGSAEMVATGQSGKLQLKARDASSFDGASLETGHAHMVVSGASEASVHALSTLSVKITEAGSVFYSGSPSIEQSVSFAGTLQAQ